MNCEEVKIAHQMATGAMASSLSKIEEAMNEDDISIPMLTTYLGLRDEASDLAYIARCEANGLKPDPAAMQTESAKSLLN